MKIDSLDIKGFGKFDQKEILPAQGFNIVFEKNESGKSTLVAFIRAMLFGLKGGRRTKDGKLPPLRRYKPWNADQYAGIIEYTLDNGESYRVGRNFDKGTVNIYDDGANNLTAEFAHDKDTGPKFSNDHLGIDAEVFDRSVFIGQLQSVIDTEGKKYLIEKLTNFASTGNEDLSLDRAINALESTLLEKVGTKNSTTRPLDKLNGEILELEKKEENLKTEQEKYLDIILELGTQKDVLVALEENLVELKKKRRSIEKRDLDKLQEELENILDKNSEFDHDLEECEQELAALKKYEDLDVHRFVEIESKLVEEQQIEYLLLAEESKLTDAKEKHAKIMDEIEPEELFEKKTEDVNEAIKKYNEYNEARIVGQNTYSSIKAGQNNKPKHNWVPFLVSAGLLSALLLIANYIEVQNPFTLGIGIVAGVFAFTLLIRKKNKDSSGLQITSEADRLNNVLLRSGFTDMVEFIRYREWQIRLKNQQEEYTRVIEESQHDLDKLNENKDVISRAWIDFASNNNIDNSSDKEKAINLIRQGIDGINSAKEKIQRVKLGKSTLNDKLEIVLREAGLIAGEILSSPNQLNKRLASYDKEEIDTSNTSIGQVDKSIKELENKINVTMLEIAGKEARVENAPNQNEIYGVLEQLNDLREKRAKLKLKGESLALASKSIKEVALLMQKDYIPKLNTQMSEMMQKLSEQRYTQIMTNDELMINVVLPETEELIGVHSLSSGTIDQIYLTMRLAAVILMEKGKEKLPLFLDEPFSQYDETRVKRAFELLKDISKERQIIFFTCRQREYELAVEVFGRELNQICLN